MPRLEYVELTILLSGTKTSETIYETYYLREQDDLLLQVAVSVDSMPDGVRIIIQPTGEALEKSSSDERLVNYITEQTVILLRHVGWSIAYADWLITVKCQKHGSPPVPIRSHIHTL